ncbi:MAG: leucine-rich repeat domain-containing protein, partial [Treponema sp.]|nr:leucine-rich repeat domain-containing protein [Treponema sp.]
MKKTFLNFLLLSFTISLFAQKNTGRVIIPESNLRFKANDDYTEVKITGFKNDNKFMGKILEIPAEIQGVPVTSIGNGAFEYAGYGISGLWIPDCIKKIDEEAFYYSMFSSVRLPNGLETIKPRTFEGCQIKTIELPSSVKKIMAFAFYGSSLESFTIPEGCEIGNPFDKDKGEYLYEK